jgi:phosphoglycolate phosphatase-like HAD superfamily hydrolase
MNIMLKRAVFLDFDGVLFDTVKEAYCISMVALSNALDISDVNMEAPHFHEFHRYRFLVGPAWNYLYLLPLINEKLDYPSFDLESVFRDAIRNQNLDKHRTFEKLFFNARNVFREKDFDKWLSLVKPYPFVASLRGLMKNHLENFFLITTRDRSSTLQILEAYDLEFLRDNVFGKEKYGISNSKKDIIYHLIEDHQVEEAIFIDDFEGHLLACDAIENLVSIQARWGYVAPEKREDNSICIIKTIENLIRGESVWT